ncbi:MAG TPA: methyltransferase domain-containing protein, partial [Chloroflexia bacterium]|nr:methyltransferase domain-containing protein [Chloroflexia bacterium]
MTLRPKNVKIVTKSGVRCHARVPAAAGPHPEPGGHPRRRSQAALCHGHVCPHCAALRFNEHAHDLWARRALAAADRAGRPAPARHPRAGYGTGTGRIAAALAQQGAQVWALDLTQEMMVRGRAGLAADPAFREPARQVHFIQGDALTLPFADRSFDCATSGFTLRNV